MMGNGGILRMSRACCKGRGLTLFHYSNIPVFRGFSNMTLFIRPIMNSSVEEIFAFKTCCGMRVFDQNLEIQITNQNDYPVYVQSYFDLLGRCGSHRME